MIKVTRSSKKTSSTMSGANGSRIRVDNLSVFDEEGDGVVSLSPLGLKGVSNKIKSVALARMRQVMQIIHDTAVSRTPVNTGRTVANFTWSLGAPILNDLPWSEDSGTPAGVSTNDMPLGSEPKRPLAEAAARLSLQRALKNLRSYSKVFFTNGTTYDDGERSFDDMEYGDIPGKPFDRRVPRGGIIRYATRKAEAYLRKN